MEKSFWQLFTRLLIVLICIIGIIFSIWFILPLVYPFIIGLIFALLFNPLSRFLSTKLKFPRLLAVLVTILLFLAIISTLVTLLVIEIVSEVNKLQIHIQENMEYYVDRIETFIMEDVVAFYDQYTAFYSSLDSSLQHEIDSYIESISSQTLQMLNNMIASILEGLFSFLGSVPLIATGLLISLLASFFISKDWFKWRERFLKLIPEKIQHSGTVVFRDLKAALFGYIKAQITLISITFMIVLIGLMILRVEYSLTLALIIGLIDLLPYLGTGLIFIPWIIYLLFSGEYSLAIGLIILYAIVLIQRQLMEPKILGDNVGLDPLTTLFALFVGFSLFGLIGLVIGPVLMVLLGAFHRAGVVRDLWTFIKGPDHDKS